MVKDRDESEQKCHVEFLVRQKTSRIKLKIVLTPLENYFPSLQIRLFLEKLKGQF